MPLIVVFYFVFIKFHFQFFINSTKLVFLHLDNSLDHLKHIQDHFQLLLALILSCLILRLNSLLFIRAIQLFALTSEFVLLNHRF